MSRLSTLCHWIGLPVAVLGLCSCGDSGGVQTAAPPVVMVMQAGTRDVPVYREWIGTMDGSENAEIRARVSGHLLSRNYQEGSFVKKGDLLFEIDSRPFVMALAEARSQLEQAKAVQIASQSEADRNKQLFERKVIAENEFTNKMQLNESNIAKVQALEAALNQAQLNLEFCKVVSPVDGVAGISMAQVGDLVGPDAGSVLTTVSVLDPLKVIFPVSEEEYLEAAENAQKVLSKPFAERPESLEIFLAGGKRLPQKARLFSVDRQVNQATGTILVTAMLPNPGALLRPGQFARARVVARTLADAVVVPQRAVADVQGTAQLAVVGPDGKVEIKPVTTGPRSGQDWVITSGLKAGETVIVEGFQKVRAGAAVDAKPWAAPADPSAPPASASTPEPAAAPATEAAK